MNEETHKSPAQTTETVTNPKQPVVPVKAPEPVKPQTTQSAEAVVSPKQATVPPVKAPEPVKAQPTPETAKTEPVKTEPASGTAPQTKPDKSEPTQPTEVPKLSDVIPTSKVWISGLIGDHQIDCLGPIEIPLKIDRPTYPFTPVPSNPNYTNQVFNYDTGEWTATDAKSQGQMLTDLAKEVANLQQIITKHEKDAEVSQAMSLQQMQMLMSITAKLDALTKKEGVK
ncbi:hypothetical protein [Lactobacillus helveticus]|uniref:hypothetical protein n=1 Tax=Lactobacillus helveticus TaxID=1587 RepID=UPI001562AC38|nr:hypothetical protein [Lactobacillus helveticus]NRN84116.1 hypothetical protein [Lactobacillus helveticus]NRN98904.1 hypothetical protein [Lactobacillus helveticus]